VATHMAKFRKYFLDKKDPQDPTSRRALEMMTNKMPDVISEFEDYWGRVVSQLNVFPQPRDVLALEVLTVVQELGKTAGDKQIEIKDETLAALADLVTKVADKGTLLNVGE
jgi:hypothetical protein